MILVDGHSDILIDVVQRHLDGKRHTLKNKHLPIMRSGKVDVLVCPVACDNPHTLPSDTISTLKHLDIIKREIEATGDEMSVVRSLDEIHKAKEWGRIAIILSMEGANPIEGDNRLLRTFYELGIRWMQLTWNVKNKVGDGVGVKEDHGLSDAGREVVKEMNCLGIVIDLTHAGEKTFYDVVEVSKAPVVVSHSNPRAVCDHVRNLTDRQIRAIADKGGVIGINFFPRLVSPSNATLRDVVKHMDYLKAAVGIEHIGLGPDFIDYALDMFAASLSASSVDYGDELIFPEDLENTTKLPGLVEELRKTGYQESEIEKVMGGNYLRVFKMVTEA